MWRSRIMDETEYDIKDGVSTNSCRVDADLRRRALQRESIFVHGCPHFYQLLRTLPRARCQVQLVCSAGIIEYLVTEPALLRPLSSPSCALSSFLRGQRPAEVDLPGPRSSAFAVFASRNRPPTVQKLAADASPALPHRRTRWPPVKPRQRRASCEFGGESEARGNFRAKPTLQRAELIQPFELTYVRPARTHLSRAPASELIQPFDLTCLRASERSGP